MQGFSIVLTNSTVTGTAGSEISESRQRVDRIFALQQANRNMVANTSAEARIAKLKKLLVFIYENRDQICGALYADLKKPESEVDLSEIYATVSEIKYTIRHVKKWMRPKRVRPTLSMLMTSSHIRYEPRGVVLIISPWNFPFNLTVGPLVSAISAGNCVMIKPSELSPCTTSLIQEMIERFFPEDEVAVFEGDKGVCEDLLRKPFDHIFFTGSSAAGKLIMKAASEHLTSVTLELGGKSPVIVDETSDITDAAEKIVWGKYLNNGQTCIAPDYVLVHESQYLQIIEAFKSEIKNTFGESETDRESSDDYARIINEEHHGRLKNLIADAVQSGARIEIGGVGNKAERYIAPTILSHVSLNSRVMREEIFGPILPVIKYDSLDEAIKFINTKEKPLALYVFSKRRKNIEKVLSNTSSGGGCINDVVLQFMHLNLPFGGVNNSGCGSSHGFFGFKAFSHERAIVRQGRFSLLKLMYPPYTGFVRKLINLTVRYL